MPRSLTVPDKQKITLSQRIILNCMSGEWCRRLCCHSRLWSVICDRRAIETTFKGDGHCQAMRLGVQQGNSAALTERDNVKAKKSNHEKFES